MPETIVQILLTGMKIFSEERRRHFESEFQEKEQAVKDAENAHSPDYSDAKLALAIEDRETFLKAYQMEFNTQMDSVLKAATKAVTGA